MKIPFLTLRCKKPKIDVWGVGTKLITAYDQPALGAVYKIVSIEDENGVMQDTIKVVQITLEKSVYTKVKNKFGASQVDEKK